MLFSTPMHIALIAFSLVAIPVAGRFLAAKKAGAAILLWLIPIALTASAADLALHGLEGIRPGSAYRAAPGGGARFALAAVVLLPPVEIFYQRIVTRIAGGGPHTKAAGEWGADATPTDPGDPEESGG